MVRVMNCHVAVISFQGVSAVDAFYELLSQDSLSVMHPEANRSVAPVEMCPILKALHRILIKRLDYFFFFFLIQQTPFLKTVFRPRPLATCSAPIFFLLNYLCMVLGAPSILLFKSLEILQ